MQFYFTIPLGLEHRVFKSSAYKYHVQLIKRITYSTKVLQRNFTTDPTQNKLFSDDCMLQLSDKIMFLVYSYSYITMVNSSKIILKSQATILFSFLSFRFRAFWRTGSISRNAHFLGDFFVFGFYLLVHAGFELKAQKNMQLIDKFNKVR